MTLAKPVPDIVVQDFASNTVVTDMVTAATFAIGPEPQLPTTAERPGPPTLSKAFCPAGTSTNTHYHPGYYVRTFVSGSYRMDGVDFCAGDMVLAEPRALTGEEGPGPAGSVELCFFESTYAATPFFLDYSDPRLSDFLAKMSPQLEAAERLTPPGPDHGASNIKLDAGRHKREYRGFSAFICQLGPQGFDGEPRPDDKSPYAIFVQFDPGAIISKSEFSYWATAVVIDGGCAINGVPQNFEVAVSIPPHTPVRFEVDDAGARAMLYFSNGADAAIFLKAG